MGSPNQLGVSDAELLRAIQVEWNKAEEAIKLSEQLGLEVSIPSISELRYAGRRIVDALDLAQNGGEETKFRALLEDARFCCHRAQHDAIDSAMAKVAIDLDDLTTRLGFEAVLDAYPEFREFYGDFSVSRSKIAASRKNREDRNAIYEAITAVDLPNLISRFDKLMAVRPIAKRSAFRRRIGTIGGLITLIAIVLTAFFAGLVVDWPKLVAPTQQQSGDK